MRLAPKSTAAFTLIEIMIVVALIGLMVTIGFPAFVKTIKRESVRKAQMDLLEACKDARAAAILTGQPVYLTFHPVEGTFEAPGFQSKLPGDIVIDMLAVNFVQLEHADLARVRFNPNGTSDEFTIVIHGGNLESVKLTLEPITALASFQSLR